MPAAGLPTQLRADLPVLFIYGTLDPTAPAVTIKNASKFIPRYQDVAVQGKGHWLMIEAKDSITGKVLSWLQSLTPKPSL